MAKPYLPETQWITARQVGDVRDLTELQRAIVARIDETDGATVGALTWELLRRGFRLAPIRQQIAAMVRAGALKAT